MLGENQTQSTISGRYGTRVWLYPREIKGFFFKYRKWTAWFLLILYLAIPWIKISGQPLFMLDVLERKMVLFGTYFWPGDIRIFLPLMIALIIVMVAVTSIFGRIWCGWMCPQTVFLQFFFEPIERFIEGKAVVRRKRDAGPKTFDYWWRKIAKHALFFFFSAIIANSFLAYFWGIDNVLDAVIHSPGEHPFAFFFMLGDSILFYGIFAWFKEQACIIMCPYARLQSALYDKKTLIVGYDNNRGEPRAKPQKNAVAPKGDCVDCGFCVKVCPTGIDIRDGLQLECIGCAKCIDACDSVMEGNKLPKGLIRYASIENLEGGKTRLFQTRFWVYSIITVFLLISFGYLISGYKSLSADLTRYGTKPYFELGNNISNVYSLRIRNKLPEADQLKLEVISPKGAFTEKTSAQFMLNPKELKSIPINIQIPKSEMKSEKIPLIIKLTNSKHSLEITSMLLGPKG